MSQALSVPPSMNCCQSSLVSLPLNLLSRPPWLPASPISPFFSPPNPICCHGDEARGGSRAPTGWRPTAERSSRSPARLLRRPPQHTRAPTGWHATAARSSRSLALPLQRSPQHTRTRRCPARRSLPGGVEALGRIQSGPTASGTRICASTYPVFWDTARNVSNAYPWRIRI